MLVGVDASDSVVETIKGQRVLAILLGLGLGLLLVLSLGQMSLGAVVGLDRANAGGNIQALADIMFSRYVFAFETTSALLITAAMGAMVLTHRERLTPKPSQQALAAQRIRDYADTGAILMLFLFVLMLVGVDASDSVVETIKGQRVLAILLGLGLGLVLVLSLGQMSLGAVVGLGSANSGGNIQALADIMFSRYVFAFETTSALLITAAMGAMVLTHRERLTPKPTQQALAAQRIRDYADKGAHLGPLPAPGVFARHNAVDTPALLPDGTAAESSISRVLAARGTVRSAPALAENIEQIQRSIDGAPATGPGPAPARTEEDQA
jgi:NADH-quinone oxidoreductase subunit J